MEGQCPVLGPTGVSSSALASVPGHRAVGLRQASLPIQCLHLRRCVTLARATAKACTAEKGYWKSRMYALPSILPNCITWGGGRGGAGGEAKTLDRDLLAAPDTSTQLGL